MVSLDDIDKRLKRLEDKFKMNFFEIEKKFTDIGSKKAEPSGLEERIQYVEDLLLLIQVENEKLREMIISPSGKLYDQPEEADKEDVSETKKISSDESRQKDVTSKPELIHFEDHGNLDKRFENLERFLTKEISHLDERLRNLEDNVFHKAPLPEKNVLEELHKILKG